MKIIAIGLDGATFDVLNPLIEAGELPNIEMLKKNGAYGNLQSTHPPITGPAWLSMATGKNPGKTGAFGFVNTDERDYSLKPISSKTFTDNKAFWDYLSQSGKIVGILNYPMLFPPYEINGFMVSGLGSSEEDDITYPSNLKEDLDNLVSGYKISIPWRSPKYKNREDVFLKDVESLIDKRWKALDYLFKHWDCDLCFVIFSAIDFLQHYLWKYWDHSHSMYDEVKSKLYRKEFVRIWRKIDEIVGKICELVGNRANIVIVSDHGFGSYEQAFYINSWLQKEGYLVFKSASKYRKQIERGFQLTLRKIIGYCAPGFYDYLVRKMGVQNGFDNLKNLLENLSDIIDFEKSKAFALTSPQTCGAIFINETVNNREKIREELIEKLKKLISKYNKITDVSIYKSEEIYEGQFTHFAADILFYINNCKCGVVSSQTNKQIFQSEPFPLSMSGSHRMNGIFIAYGPHIKATAISTVQITDIAPTMLYMSELPIPNDMCGRVLTKIFTEDYLNSNPIQEMDAPEMTGYSGYERHDKSQLEKRLKGLGYL